jgi:hypothetical protein
MEKLSLNDLSEQLIKEELAEKVLRGKKLNIAEKETIYHFLTGRKPQSKKRGRPSTKVRDYRLALNFLTTRDKYPKRSASKIRDDLAKEYGLSDKDNTFYIALKRGIEILRSRTECSVINDEETLYRLKMIDVYKKKNEHLKK